MRLYHYSLNSNFHKVFQTVMYNLHFEPTIIRKHLLLSVNNKGCKVLFIYICLFVCLFVFFNLYHSIFVLSIHTNNIVYFAFSCSLISHTSTVLQFPYVHFTGVQIYSNLIESKLDCKSYNYNMINERS